MFSLTQLQSMAEVDSLTNLYDKYCIKAIKLRYIPRHNSIRGADAGEVAGFAFMIAKDYDDAITPTSISEVQNYKNCRTIPSYKGFSVYLKPCVDTQVYSGGAAAFAGKRNVWIDCQYRNVEHYGIKWCAQSGGPTTGPSAYYDIVVTYYLTFAGRR